MECRTFFRYGILHLLSLLLAGTASKIQMNSSAESPHKCPSPNDAVTSISDLYTQYCNIFPTGNRNAASFKWYKFIQDRASSKSESEILELNKGYCPISGSPIQGTSRGKVTLKKVGGGTETGLFHFCCTPCLCDMVDLVRVDTKTVAQSGGSSNFNVLVMGNPCTNPNKLDEDFTDPFSGAHVSLKSAAPEITCTGSQLDGAILSDAGHPIIGILYADDGGNSLEAADMVEECAQRASGGYASGMGLIFRKVAEISPLS